MITLFGITMGNFSLVVGKHKVVLIKLQKMDGDIKFHLKSINTKVNTKTARERGLE